MIRRFLLMLAVLVASLALDAQTCPPPYGVYYVGSWVGTLNAGVELRVVFNIEMLQGKTLTYSATMDSPDQGVKGIPCTTVEVKDSVLTIDISGQITYQGRYNEETGKIEGTFEQNGMSLPLELSKVKAEKAVNDRPQTPQPPFPYVTEDVTFSHDGVTLAGTLTKPTEGAKHPAVVLVTGSGPQDRNETIMRHKPFLVIADYLTRQGIAVLRYDDRGVGRSSIATGFETTLDLAQDAMAAVRYLRGRDDIDASKVGIIGHSEGGLIAMINAAEYPKEVSFIASLAGPAIKGKDMMIAQNLMIMESQGMVPTEQMKEEITSIFIAIDESKDVASLRAELQSMLGSNPQYSRQIPALTSPAYVAMIKMDPTPYLKKIKCPVLALNGGWDSQVAATENLAAIKQHVKRAEVKQYERLNHLFQTCENRTQSMAYGQITETMAPQVLADLAAWVLRVTK
ncbi:MAG: alpha/beta fold hydrolase [Muribaculaceae bacterium]|nr:alpha/beta fold hydrolase [Muribaculaceae bacterium]